MTSSDLLKGFGIGLLMVGAITTIILVNRNRKKHEFIHICFI